MGNRGSPKHDLFEPLDTPFQVGYVLFQALHMVGMESLVFGLIEGNPAHEFAEVIKTLFYPPKTRVSLVEPLIEVLPQLFDAVSDLLEDLGGKIGSHDFKKPSA